MGTTRPELQVRSFRVVYWSGISGPDRRRKPKRAFEPVICFSGPEANGRACWPRFFAGRRGLS